MKTNIGKNSNILTDLYIQNKHKSYKGERQYVESTDERRELESGVDGSDWIEGGWSWNSGSSGGDRRGSK